MAFLTADPYFIYLVLFYVFGQVTPIGMGWSSDSKQVNGATCVILVICAEILVTNSQEKTLLVKLEAQAKKQLLVLQRQEIQLIVSVDVLSSAAAASVTSSDWLVSNWLNALRGFHIP